MKLPTLILILLIPISLNGQMNSSIQSDSVNVRVFNSGKHYIKELIVTVNNHEYRFSDIWKREYSEYQRLPFIWPSNRTEVTIIVKRLFKYDDWFTMIIMPIDHVGESKNTSGSYTLYAEPRIKKGKLVFDSHIIKE